MGSEKDTEGVELPGTYNVEYILLTSEWGYLKEPKIDPYQEYVPKIRSNSDYESIFDSCPSLKLCFVSGTSRIYKVIY